MRKTVQFLYKECKSLVDWKNSNIQTKN